MLQKVRMFFLTHRFWIGGLILLYAGAWVENGLLMSGVRQSRDKNIQLWSRVIQGGIQTDILIVGSSRALVHYDCALLTRELGKSCYNAGLNGARVYLQLALVKEFFKHNPPPAFVIVDVDRITSRGFLPPFELKSVYDPVQYLPFLNEPEVRKAFCDVDSSCWKHRWIPLYGLAVYGKEVWTRFLSGFFRQNSADGREAYRIVYSTWKNNYENYWDLHSEGTEVHLDPEGMKYFHQMINEFKSRKIPGVVVHSPEYQYLQKTVLNYRALSEELGREAAREGFPYWDFTTLKINSNGRYFRDSRHLNYYGTQIFSRLLSARLKDLLAEFHASA